MKHQITQEGLAFRLRPVTLQDAAFIVEIRLADAQRNQYIHQISAEVSVQENWLNEYFKREGDYYFVVENKFTHQPEGLIGLYDVQDGKAEWGRWVIKQGSLAAAESVDLIFRVAFDVLHLQECYSRTIEDNVQTVAFHDSVKELRRAILQDCFTLHGKTYNAVEHYVTPQHFEQTVHPLLQRTALRIFQRFFKQATQAELTFHHLGVACRNMQRDLLSYGWLGYSPVGEPFEDPQQGIKGLFLQAKGQPTLELLENLPGAHTLDAWINNRVKIYHFAYTTPQIEKTLKVFLSLGAKLISPMKQSTYFQKRICFFMLPNMFMIELIEKI